MLGWIDTGINNLFGCVGAVMEIECGEKGEWVDVNE